MILSLLASLVLVTAIPATLEKSADSSYSSSMAKAMDLLQSEPADSSRVVGIAVLVSIAPQQFFVEAIGKEHVQTVVLVPPGASPHSYEPTPKQLLRAAQADLWLRIGEPFEQKSEKVLKSCHPQLVVVDTRKGVELLQSNCAVCSADTHIWLSPKRAKVQAGTILEALTQVDPEHAPQFLTNYRQLIEQLDQLDRELHRALDHSLVRAILVSHPAFGYLCADYQLRQLSLEVEGKELSPRQLTNLLQLAKELQIRRVFAQKQYSDKAACLLAKELQAEVVFVDPYSADYLNNLRKIGELFAGR